LGLHAGGQRAGVTPPRILCYHKVDRRVELGVTRLSPRRFARQVERLARRGCTTLSLDELRARLTGARRSAPHEIAITFVVTDYAGKLNRWDIAYGGRRFAHLAWRDMRRWQSRGIEFASHTASHPRLTWLADDDVAGELSRSRAAIREALDVDPGVVSWPFGADGEREHRIAEREGYTLGLTIGDARRWDGDLFAVPRHPVYMWSPATPGFGVLAGLDILAGTVANRCAIGTSIIQRRRQRTRVAEQMGLADTLMMKG